MFYLLISEAILYINTRATVIVCMQLERSNDKNTNSTACFKSKLNLYSLDNKFFAKFDINKFSISAAG